MLTPDVMKLAVDESLAAPRFVMHYLNSEVARQIAFGKAFGTTRLRPTLPLFRDLLMPLPPRVEQDRIIAEVDRTLSVSGALMVDAIHGVARCSRLRQSILKWAFEGNLVDQDPNDEPASVLLERIRAERGAAGSGPIRKARHTRMSTDKRARRARAIAAEA